MHEKSSMASLRKKIREWAILTRLYVLIMQAVFNILIKDHDAEDVFHSPKTDDGNSVIDWFSSILIGGLGNWDGQYFLHIAKYGYTYENCLVFFPLFPTVVKILANTLGLPTFFFLPNHYGTLFICICLNFICFVISAEVFYELSRHVLREERLAYYAALLYCINPATIFFTAAYSETLFALFTFLGMLLYERHYWFSSSFCFALGSASRSNGIINCGFPIYQFLREFFSLINSQKKCSSIFSFTGWTIFTVVQRLLVILVNVFIIIAPFISHQTIAYKIFCFNDKNEVNLPLKVKEYGEQKGYNLPFNESPAWCYNYFPVSYSHIQAQHWNVGFLKYYEFKQIPNFLLALPIVMFISFAFYQYVTENWNYCLWLGLKNVDSLKKYKDANIGLMNPRCFLYLCHVSALTVYGCFFIHIQVLTRMLCSSSPLLYWFAANAIMTEKRIIPADVNSSHQKSFEVIANRVETFLNLKQFGENKITECIRNWSQQTFVTQLILTYFLSYLIIGTAMFVNFYPFT